MAGKKTDRERIEGDSAEPRHPSDLVFVGFNKRVVALDRDSGELVWQWKARQGSGFVVMLYDGDRLIVSVQGYTYCLDPATGDEMWSNPLKGMGVGAPCLASVSGVSNPAMLGEAEAQIQAAAAGG
jgi:outer membrane protein assembly factor BamB